eukprot:77302_1
MSGIVLTIFLQLSSSIILTDPTEPPECIEIKSMHQSIGINFNGYWDEAGIYNNNMYYTFNGNYLFVSIKYNLWIISSKLSDIGNIYAFCGESNVISCSSKWYYIDSVSNMNTWTIDSDVVILDCTNIEPVEPTENPTQTERTEVIESSECIEIKSLQPSMNIDFNGYWYEAGIYNNNIYYTLNGYYLFVSITYNLWLISAELGDTAAATFAFCSESDIELCSLKWYYYDSLSNTLVADSDAIVIDCTNMEPIEPPECVGIESLEQSMGTDLNGNWDESGIYNNNVYYTLNGYYLFVSIQYNLWIISSELSDIGNIYAFCGESNVISCSSKWYYIDSVSNMNTWTIDSDVVILDCTNIEPVEPTENPTQTERTEVIESSFCDETNVILCSSKWNYIDSVSNSWTVGFDSITFDCDNMPNSETTKFLVNIEETKYYQIPSNEVETNSDSDD